MVGEFPETYHNSIQKNDQSFLFKFPFLKFSVKLHDVTFSSKVILNTEQHPSSDPLRRRFLRPNRIPTFPTLDVFSAETDVLSGSEEKVCFNFSNRITKKVQL